MSDAGPANTTFDNTPARRPPGVLFGFVGGREARAFGQLRRAERRKRVLRQLRRPTTATRRATPRATFEQDWSEEEWTRGCPVGASPAPGVLLDYGAGDAHARRAHPLGGDRDVDYWNGYMDGAVRSGERAAREVLKA